MAKNVTNSDFCFGTILTAMSSTAETYQMRPGFWGGRPNQLVLAWPLGSLPTAPTNQLVTERFPFGRGHIWPQNAGRDTHSPEVTAQVLPQLWKFIYFFVYRDVRRFINRYANAAYPELKI